MDELTKIKNSLNKKEDRYKRLSEASFEGILFSYQCQFIDANKQLAEMFGYQLVDLQNINLKEVIHPGDFNFVYNKMLSKEDSSYEFKGLKKDKSIIWIETNSKVIDIKGYKARISVLRDITNKKKAEITLKSNQLLLSKVFNTSFQIIGISILDTGKFIMINSGFEKNLGYLSQEVIGKSSNELNIWVNGFDRKNILKQLQSKESIRNIEVQYYKKDRSIITCVCSIEKIEFEEKNCLITIAEDITERKKAEKKIKEKDDNLKAIFNSVSDGIFTLHNEYFYNVNPFAEKLFGYSEKELKLKTPADISPQYQPDGELSTVKASKKIAAALNGESQFFEWKHILSSGELIDTEVSLNKIENNEENMVLAVVRDVTKRKKAEQEIIENQRKLNTLFSNLPGMAYRCKNDDNWTMDFVSDGCFSLTGYTSEEILNNQTISFADIMHPDDFKWVWDINQDALSKKQAFTVEYRIITKDNKIKWVWEQGCGIYDNEGNIIALEGFITDITAKIEARNELEKYKLNLEYLIIKRTEQLEKETKAKEQEQEKYKILIETSNEGIWIIDKEFKTTFVNDRLLEILGYTRKEMLGIPYYLFIVSEEQEANDHEMKKRKDGGKSIYERKFIRKDGNIVLLLASATPLMKNGEFEGSFAMFSDITEKTNQINEIIKLNERFNLAMDAGKLGMWEVNQQTKEILYASPIWQETMGISENEFEKLTLDLFLEKIYPDDLKKLSYNTIYPDDTYICEFRLKHPEKGYIWIALSSKIITKTKNKEPEIIIGFCKDIDRIKQIESELKESHQLLKSITDSIDNTIYVKDLTGKFIFGNKSFLKIFDHLEESPIGKDVSCLFKDEYNQNLAREIDEKVFTEKKAITIEVKPDSESDITHIHTKTPLFNTKDEIIGLCCIGTDISYLKEKEKELQKEIQRRIEAENEAASINEELHSANDQLREQHEELDAAISQLIETQKQLILSEKMASLGVLIAGVAHEINNPINFINGGIIGLNSCIKSIVKLLNLYKSNINRAEIEQFEKEIDIEFSLQSLEQLQNGIEVGITQIVEIVRSLQTVSRNSSTKIKTIDINQIIDFSLIIFHNQYKGRINVVKNYGNIPHINGNESNIQQVIMNLISNAIQSIESNGQITITTKCNDTTILLQIEDNGNGIPENIQGKIFDPFFTTKEVGKGTGLGLYIVFEIIQEHKGNITFESKEGLGTIFKISLPISQNQTK